MEEEVVVAQEEAGRALRVVELNQTVGVVEEEEAGSTHRVVVEDEEEAHRAVEVVEVGEVEVGPVHRYALVSR